MNIFLSIVIGTVTYLAFGYVVFEMILGKYTKRNTLQLKGFNKSDKDSSMAFLILSCASYATLITFVLYNWQTDLSAEKAFLVSGIIGILVATMANTFLHGTTHFYNNIKPLLVDVAGAFVAVGVLGIVVSLII
jgi:hypothetical protein